MILRCPCCGTTASMECWNDQHVENTLKALAEFPHPTGSPAIEYLSLFRPEKTVLSFKKASHLLAELAELVKAGSIKVQRQHELPITPIIWARAMMQMVNQRDAIKRPLKNHNYLRQVAYRLAEEKDQAGIPPCKGGRRSQGDFSEDRGTSSSESEESPFTTNEDFEFWQKCFEALGDEIPAESMGKYFMGIEIVEVTEKEVVLRSPNDFIRKLIKANFMTQLNAAVKKVGGKPRNVKLLAEFKGGV